MAGTSFLVQAAQQGLQINLTNISTGISFSGGTCVLLITDFNGNMVSYPLTISVDGFTAFFVTVTGEEIPTAGMYSGQLQFSSFEKLYYSSVFQIKALSNLN